MDAYESRILREFRDEVEEAIAQKASMVSQGSLTDHSAYKHQCGIIQGMRDALAIAEEIEKRIIE